jgi:hypothetical protein
MCATVESIIETTPRKRIIVTREKLAAYLSAIRAFKSGRQNNQYMMTPKDWTDYKVKLEEVRAKILGDQYQSGGGWTVLVRRPRCCSWCRSGASSHRRRATQPSMRLAMW